MNTRRPTLWPPLIAYTILLAVLWAATGVLREGPALSTLRFDTDSALKIERSLIPENRPHPSGSQENMRVANRIESTLTGYGYDVERQGGLFCTEFAPGCTRLENLVAIKPGIKTGGDAILLTAHYDGIAAGPGAADDMAGVAALLEIARELEAVPPLQNDVIFLIADAEETGLRGAQAFVQHHPLMERVKLVLNLEARGVTGPSQMFETSVGNDRLIGLLASTVSRPVASSLMYEAYRRMPNNTDLTIYKKSGALGVNFAFSRGVALYHSVRDDLEHLNPASLGHHGDNVLHYVLAAGNTDLASLESTSDASYIDLFGTYLLTWPAALNLPAAVLALLLVLGTAWSTRSLRIGALAGSFGIVLLLIVSQAAAGWLLSWPLARWPGIHGLDHPYPGAGNIALFSCSVLLTLFWASFAGKRIDRSAFLYACWVFYALLACLFAWAIAGAAYLVLLPVAVFALASVIERILGRKTFPTYAAWAGLVAASYIAVYHFIFMDVLTSFHAAWLKMLPLSLGAIAAAPVFAFSADARRGVRASKLALTAVLVIATAAASLVPAYTQDRPRSVNIAYQQINRQDGAQAEHQSAWRMYTFGAPDKDFARAAGFPDQQDAFKRWGLREGKAYFRDVPGLELAPPIFSLAGDSVDGDVRTLTGTVQAGRSGPLLGLVFTPGTPVNGLTVNGTPVLTGENYKIDKGAAVTFNGVGDEPLAVELTVPADSSFDLVVFELSAFPENPDGKAIIDLRPADAAEIHFGDHTEIQNHYHFQGSTDANLP